MKFSLDFWTITLLIAAIAIILLVTSEMLSSYHGKVNILINKKRLRNTAIAAAIAFLITAAMRIISLIIV